MCQNLHTCLCHHKRVLPLRRWLLITGDYFPTVRIIRIEDICWVIDQMKAKGEKLYTRMDTNGTGSLIHGRDIAPEFAGRFDMVSISLNTDTAEKYNALCHPQQEGSYEAMKAFAKEIQKYVPKVMMTVVDTIPQEEIENCRRICEDEIGAIYRVREYIED